MSSSSTGPAQPRKTALDYATNDAQKQKWLIIHSKLTSLLRTDVTHLEERINAGMDLLDDLVRPDASLGTKSRAYNHELFKVGKQVLSLMLRTVEKAWGIQAHKLGLDRWDLKPSHNPRPTGSDPKEWRVWGIGNQLDVQHHDLGSAYSLAAGKSVIAMARCRRHVLRVARKDGSGEEAIELEPFECGAALWEAMGRSAVWAISGFGWLLLRAYGESEMKIGTDGFGLRTWQASLSVH